MIRQIVAYRYFSTHTNSYLTAAATTVASLPIFFLSDRMCVLLVLTKIILSKTDRFSFFCYYNFTIAKKLITYSAVCSVVVLFIIFGTLALNQN